MEYQNNYQSTYQNVNQKVGPRIPEEYKPLSPWAYVGYNLLFMIPLVGIIMLFVFSFSNKNINRRNYARSYFCALLIGGIIGFIGIVITIGLSAVVMNSSTDTINLANYAKFAQEFGEYTDQIVLDGATLRSNVAIKGQYLNTAQNYFMVANGYTDKEENDAIQMRTPAGYVLPQAIQYALYGEENDEVVAYVIEDKNISCFENGLDLYEDKIGEEFHLVTSDGVVFTIPGFPRKQEDGSIEYTITSSGKAYIVSENSINENVVDEPITAQDFDKIYGIDMDLKTVKSSPIYKKGLEKK